MRLLLGPHGRPGGRLHAPVAVVLAPEELLRGWRQPAELGADRPAGFRAGGSEIGPGRAVLPGARQQERRAAAASGWPRRSRASRSRAAAGHRRRHRQSRARPAGGAAPASSPAAARPCRPAPTASRRCELVEGDRRQVERRSGARRSPPAQASPRRRPASPRRGSAARHRDRASGSWRTRAASVSSAKPPRSRACARVAARPNRRSERQLDGGRGHERVGRASSQNPPATASA